MFRKLMATTAIAALLTGAAVAQQATTPADPATTAPATAPAEAEMAQKAPIATKAHLASNLIGENVYNGTAADAAKVGDVNDLVIDENGAVKSIVVGVGGFLGVGEKSVELDYKTAEWAEKNGDQWLVVSMTKEQMEALPAFDAAPYEPVAPASTGSTAPSAAPAADPTAPPATAPQNEQPKPAN